MRVVKGKNEPMFDFNPVSQLVAALLLVWMASYFIAIPVAAVSGAAARAVVEWNAAIFPLGACLLLTEGLVRLKNGRMTSTQLTSYRFSAIAIGLTSLINFGTNHWVLAPIGVVAAAFWFLPLKRHTQPSTWGQS